MGIGDVLGVVIFAVMIIAMFVFMGLGVPVFLSFLLGFVVAAAVAGMIVKIYEKTPMAKDEEEKRSKENDVKMKIMFYDACKEHKISNIINGADRQKAEIIAQNKGIKYDDFDLFFKEAFIIGKEKDDREKRLQLAAVRKQEEETYKQLIKYWSFKGRDKRIRMIKDEIEGLEAVTKLPGMIASSAYQEKERDWAIEGGLFGLGAAIDAQIENVEIRARNQANREAVEKMAFGSAMTGAVVGAWGKICDLKGKLKKAEIALVSEEDSQSLLKLLDFYDIQHFVTETGAIRIKGKVKLKQKHFIYDKTEAVVDGVVVANVYQENSYIGSAKIVLPCFGVSEKASNFETMCLCDGKEKKNIEIKYGFDSFRGGMKGEIWAMEK